MKNDQESHKPYVWVKDPEGKEFLCPADALKDVADASDEELKSCIDVDALKPYVGDI